MDMTPIQWVLIVLLVLLIAVGVYMLTRKPSSGQGRSEEVGESAAGQSAASYGAGGDHVTAGDAGVTPSAPLYDQEADAAAQESSVQDDPIDAPVWDDDDSVGQDTATGGDIEIVEEEPVVSATEDVEPLHAPADEAAHGDREQMSYGDPHAEDFASETVYAEAPVQEHAAVDDTYDVETYAADPDDVGASEVPDAVVMDDSDDVPSDAAAAGFVGATVMGSDQASDAEVDADSHVHADGDHEADMDEGHVHEGLVAETPDPPADGSAGSENTGPEDSEGGAEDRDAERGHPGMDSQPGEIEVVEPEVAFADGSQASDVLVVVDVEETQDDEPVGETDTSDNDEPQAVMVDVNDYGTHESVQPDHDAVVTEEDTYSPVVVDEDNSDESEHPAAQEVPQDDYVAEGTAYAPVVAEDVQADTVEEQPGDEPVTDAADEPNPLIEASPYGVGSAIPGDDGSGPEGYEIKGNAGSMLFHTPESPSYDECTPAVFFENEDAARAAGFAHWDRKRR